MTLLDQDDVVHRRMMLRRRYSTRRTTVPGGRCSTNKTTILTQPTRRWTKIRNVYQRNDGTDAGDEAALRPGPDAARRHSGDAHQTDYSTDASDEATQATRRRSDQVPTLLDTIQAADTSRRGGGSTRPGLRPNAPGPDSSGCLTHATINTAMWSKLQVHNKMLLMGCQKILMLPIPLCTNLLWLESLNFSVQVTRQIWGRRGGMDCFE